MKLAELERYFATAVTSGSGPIAGLDQVFHGSERLSASSRLAIYNRGYHSRLLDALSSVFGETKRVLGAAEFERLGLRYVSQKPSSHPAVERFGRLFSDHLRGQQSLPSAVADLAELEWARLCALVAPNPRTLARASAIEPKAFPEARLRFVASLQCLELEPRALQAFAGNSPPLPWAPNGPNEPLERTGVAIWRSGHIVHHESLAPLEFRALCAARKGSVMARMCAVFDTGEGDADAERAFHVVAAWFGREWVESVG